VLAERRVTDQSHATPASVYDNGLFQLRFRKLLKSLARSYDDAGGFQRAKFPCHDVAILQYVISAFSHSQARLSVNSLSPRTKCSQSCGGHNHKEGRSSSATSRAAHCRGHQA